MVETVLAVILIVGVCMALFSLLRAASDADDLMEEEK